VLAVEIHQRSGTSSDISFDLEVSGVATIPNPTRKAPYLIYTGNNQEMRVLWQLFVPDTCQISWGLDSLYSLGSAEVFEYGGDHQYTYIVENLTPATKYFYRVVAAADTFHGSFHTAPYSHAGEARFFAYGDTRTYPATHDQVAQAIIAAFAATPSMQSIIISVGDLISNGNLETDWDGEFFDASYPNIRSMLANLPYQSCMGNHEGSGVLFSKYFPYPFVANRYWSFDYGPAHFVVVDQYVPYNSGSIQHTWIANDLAASTKPWKFVYLHEPGWSAGGGHGNNVTVQNDIQPLCELYGVSLVFAGHNHYYARAAVNGVQHVTTGGGGAPLHVPDLGYPNVVAGSSANHYCVIETDGGSLSFTALSIAGDTLDQFTLQGTVTGIESEGESVSLRDFVLEDAFPNPFNPRTTISFVIPEAAHVDLTIYDVQGRKVRTLVDRELRAGRHEVSWDGNNDDGQRSSSGLYFYQLRSGDKTESRKMLLLK
jgi:hypothetical protein